MSPPPDVISLPIIHKIDVLYKNFYQLKKGFNKTDRYGLCLKIEELILEIFQFSIEAALSPPRDKFVILQKLRIKLEVLKRLIRILVDIKVILPKKYLGLEEALQEISKMATGWQKYSTNKES